MKLISFLVPRSWRETVLRDIEDEARERGKGRLWRVVQTLRVAMRLQPAVNGDTARYEIVSALRSLWRARGFSAGAIVTIALGLGVNIAVFSAVDRLMFRKLPYGDSDQLFLMRYYDRVSGQRYGTMAALYLAEGSKTWKSIDSITTVGDPQLFDQQPEQGDAPPLRMTTADQRVLDVTRSRVFLGRGFATDDDALERRVVILRYATWQNRFGGGPGVIGQTVWRNGAAHEVIGVLPPEFFPPTAFADPEWDGLVLAPDDWGSVTPETRAFPPVARLRPGVSLEEANAELAALVSTLKPQLAPDPAGFDLSLRLEPLRSAMFGFFAPYINMVMAACGAVLLLACVNLAGLFVARGQRREREVAVRASLGESPARLIASGVTESVLICSAGCVVALFVLALVENSLRATLPPIFAGYAADVMEPRVIGFAFLTALVISVCAGVMPGVRMTRVDLLAVLQRVAGGGRGRVHRQARLLIGCQAALTVVLIGAATVSTRSFTKLVSQPLGFATDDLFSVVVRPPRTTDPIEAHARARQALEAIRSTPGVRSVTGADAFFWQRSMTARIAPEVNIGSRWRITEDYFSTGGIPVLAGEPFGAAEVRNNTPIAVVSEMAARILFPLHPPREVVGQTLRFTGEPDRRIVAVVGDTRDSFSREPRPSLFLPLTAERFRYMWFMARAEPGQALSVKAIRDRVRAGIGPVATVGVSALETGYELGLIDARFRALLFGTFGLAALAIAAAGLYATVSLDVALRREEVGVRLALGANPAAVRRMVIAGGIRPVAIGAIGGIVVAWWAGEFIQAFLFRVDARDPATHAVVVAILLVTATAAAWLPARRASRVDPAIVLRAQ